MLSRKYGWSPREIARLTPYQQAVYLGGAGRYVTVKSQAEAERLIQSLNNG